MSQVNMNETEVLDLDIRRILPMEMNLVIRNIRSFVFQKKYSVNRTDNQPVYFYLDAATYNNLGDQAISLAIEWFLDDVFGKEHVRVINETDVICYIQSLRNQIHKDDVIVLSGGGNMGDLYPRYEAIRRLVIKSFPDNKIVVFPQTIDYTDDRYGRTERMKSSKIYSLHRNMIVCAREMKSFIAMKQLYPNVILVPDIVFYLYGKLDLQTTDRKDIVGICMRRDKESVVDETSEERIYIILGKNGFITNEISTVSNLYYTYTDFSSRKTVLEEKIREFSKYSGIITDRLHGMIFSLLAGIPCVALDNSNRKVSEVYKIVKDRADCIELIEDVDNFNCSLFTRKCNRNCDFTELYEELKRAL